MADKDYVGYYRFNNNTGLKLVEIGVWVFPILNEVNELKYSWQAVTEHGYVKLS